jgi:SDR family mycofactocin-dependent oxidoreductase
VAFITGGARGQGRAHALKLAAHGADVAVVDIGRQIDSVPYPLGTDEQLAETVALVEARDRRALGITCDVRSQDAVDAAVAQTITELGQIDFLIVNHGIWSGGALHEIDDEAWQDMLDVDLTGVWRCLKAVVPHMIERQFGAIVLTASVNGVEGNVGYAHYVAAKHGVVGLMRSAALEYARYDIRCNAVLPGFIDSGMTDWQGLRDATAYEGADKAAVHRQAHYWHALKGRGLLPPESVSGAVYYLVSPDSSDVTGHMIPVEGGHLALPGGNGDPVFSE